MSDPEAVAGGNRPVAVQLYSMRDELARDRAGVLRRLAGFGYRTVEPFDVLTDPDGLRAELDAAGLAVCSVHTQPVRGRMPRPRSAGPPRSARAR